MGCGCERANRYLVGSPGMMAPGVRNGADPAEMGNLCTDGGLEERRNE